MSYTKIQICRQAITLVGGTPPNTLADHTVEARLCAEHYDRIYKSLLARTAWSFALKIANLSLIEEIKEPIDYYLRFKFQLPTDYIRLIDKKRTVIRHRIIGKELYYSRREASIIYVANVSEGLISDSFASYLIYELAIQFSISFEMSQSKIQSLTQIKDKLFDSASIQDANASVNNGLSVTGLTNSFSLIV